MSLRRLAPTALLAVLSVTAVAACSPDEPQARAAEDHAVQPCPPTSGEQQIALDYEAATPAVAGAELDASVGVRLAPEGLCLDTFTWGGDGRWQVRRTRLEVRQGRSSWSVSGRTLSNGQFLYAPVTGCARVTARITVVSRDGTAGDWVARGVRGRECEEYEQDRG